MPLDTFSLITVFLEVVFLAAVGRYAWRDFSGKAYH
jgi:hypothetical protein